MPTIAFSEKIYDPNPFFIDAGGNMYIKYDVDFEGASPPASFNYEVKIKDRDGNTVRTMSGTIDNPQQTGNTVKVYWDGKDESAQMVPLNGGYGPDIKATASGFDEETDSLCSGIQPGPGSGGGNCDPCEDNCS